MPSKKKKIKLKNYSVNAAVHGSKHLGVFRASSPEAAIEMAEAANGWCSLCHECSSECEDPQIGECTADETDEEPDHAE